MFLFCSKFNHISISSYNQWSNQSRPNNNNTQFHQISPATLNIVCLNNYLVDKENLYDLCNNSMHTFNSNVTHKRTHITMTSSYNDQRVQGKWNKKYISVLKLTALWSARCIRKKPKCRKWKLLNLDLLLLVTKYEIKPVDWWTSWWNVPRITSDASNRTKRRNLEIGIQFE